MNHHLRSAQVWHVLSRDLTVLPAHPHVYLQSEWAIPAFEVMAAGSDCLPVCTFVFPCGKSKTTGAAVTLGSEGKRSNKMAEHVLWFVYLIIIIIFKPISELCTPKICELNQWSGHNINTTTTTGTVVCYVTGLCVGRSLQVTLLVGWQEGHPTCKKLGVSLLVATFWLELCTSYSSSCHHHLHHPQLQ